MVDRRYIQLRHTSRDGVSTNHATNVRGVLADMLCWWWTVQRRCIARTTPVVESWLQDRCTSLASSACCWGLPTRYDLSAYIHALVLTIIIINSVARLLISRATTEKSAFYFSNSLFWFSGTTSSYCMTVLWRRRSKVHSSLTFVLLVLCCLLVYCCKDQACSVPQVSWWGVRVPLVLCSLAWQSW